MSFVQLPLSDDLWFQFLALHNMQGSVMSHAFPRPATGIWLLPYQQKLTTIQLVVGLCVYDTDGPFVVAEHLVSNPAYTLRERFRAFDMALGILRAVATAKSKWIIAHPSKKGLSMYLQRRGFKQQNVNTLTSPPGLAT